MYQMVGMSDVQSNYVEAFADGTNSFTLSSPMVVQDGNVMGLMTRGVNIVAYDIGGACEQ